MKVVTLVHQANGHMIVLVEEGADVEVLLVDEADPPQTRLQVLGERATREEIDIAIADALGKPAPKAKTRTPKEAAQPARAAPQPPLPGPREIDAVLDETWTREPMLSDHARLRYLQRVKGWDVAIADREILTRKNRDAIRAGVSALYIGGWRLPVAPDGRIKTVVPREPKKPLDRQRVGGRPEERRASGRKRADYVEEQRS